MPVILIAVVGAIMLLISAAISFLQSVAATELDPDSRDLLALAHARYAMLAQKLICLSEAQMLDAGAQATFESSSSAQSFVNYLWYAVQASSSGC